MRQTDSVLDSRNLLWQEPFPLPTPTPVVPRGR